MNVSRFSPALVAVSLVVVAACGGGGAPSVGNAVGSTSSPLVASSALPAASSPVAAGTSPASSSAAAGSSTAAIGVPDTCALATTAEIGAAIGTAVKPGQDITADTAWSSACAWVLDAAAGQPTYSVLVKALANGTLVSFAKMADAKPVAALGDEAYAFDNGRQIAIRFGNLVTIVAGARGIDGKGVPATATESLARLIATRIAG